jgi:iron(III) transport system substrate-binding protein
MTSKTFLRTTSAVLAFTVAAPLAAQEVNVYSSRHYDSDDALYEEFTKRTGIEVNRIEGDADELIARLAAEGDNSPADVFLTVDAGRMNRAEDAGLLQAYGSDVIRDRIPENLRHPGDLWFGISQRARIIFYHKDRVAEPPQTYEALADEAWRDTLCIRSSSNVYNQSLMAAIIHADGEDAARAWAEGIVANMARSPQGGDTDQLRALVSGECDVAVSNHYYFLRAFGQEVDGLTGSTDQLGWVWPNQDGRGTHVNLAVAAMTAAAPNADEARAFLEFLTSDYAQAFIAEQNDEFTAVPGTASDEDTARMGAFIADSETPTAVFSTLAGAAQTIFNEAGWD